MHRLDHAGEKRRAKLRAAARGRPDESREMTLRHPAVSLRGWRLTDGVEYPVIVRKIEPEESTDALHPPAAGRGH